jgi:hypothetical protein
MSENAKLARSRTDSLEIASLRAVKEARDAELPKTIAIGSIREGSCP